MSKHSKTRVLSLLLSAVLLSMSTGAALADTAADTTTTDAAATTEPTADGSTPLVVAYGEFSQKFSPFVADTTYDRDVSNMTQIGLMTTDRQGGIIFNGIEGETVNYNGTDYLYTGTADLSVNYDEDSDTTTYTAKLRDDMYFSDGVKVTADDVIFSYYTLLDPTYVGSTTLNSYDIVGLQEYRTQIASDSLAKFTEIADGIAAAGIDHEWADTDAWTKEQQDSYWSIMKQTWEDDNQAIVDYVMASYLDGYADKIGFTADEITAEPGLQVALGMTMWGFATVDENKLMTTSVTGTTFDLANGVYPTIEDMYNETYAAYEGDAAAYWETEQADSDDVLGTATTAFLNECNAESGDTGEGVPNISGITKLDDYTVQVVVNGYEAPAVYTVLGIDISPMHYYGDESKYDYENNKFGFDFGDLSLMLSKTTEPMGAGAYKFVKYENRVVYFEANENYYEGAPAIKYIQFKETNANEFVPGISAGTIDQGNINGSKSDFEQIAGYNSNGEITGDVMTTATVDNMGYGYIGMNADTIKVGEEPLSDASKNLRKALATVLSVYRTVAYDSYYGSAASVINYPISNTSWAAPQSTDEDYKVAFSVDVDGNDIYTSDMTEDDKYAAAIEAAKGYLIAAGYTFDESTGKFTAAPEGAKLTYEVTIGADGVGDHPSFAVLTDAQAALATIGIDLKINDLSNTAELWDLLDSGEQELWCAAWNSTIDPDMYQVYYSGNIVGLGGSDSNHYHLADASLDAMIIDARQSDDQAYRKAVYKQALDFIVDAAVEIPCYQRQNCELFSSIRIDCSTITPDITTFWGWKAGIDTLAMAK